MAAAAAFEDPRFRPLTQADLAQTEIEISRLSVPRPASPTDVIPGRHGVCVTRGDYRGVFLPQVAERYGWDREQLLAEACLKAMLPANAWRDAAATLLIFEAEVFNDSSLTPQTL